MKFACLLLLALLPYATANADDAEITVLMRSGGKTCGDWVESRAKGPPASNYNEVFMLGYMSGLAAGSKVDFLKGVTGNAIYVWMDNFCKKAPLQTLDNAGNWLSNDLILRKYQ